MTTTTKQMDILINNEHLLKEMQEILNEIYENASHKPIFENAR